MEQLGIAFSLKLVCWLVEQSPITEHIIYRSLQRLSLNLKQESVIRGFGYGWFVDVPNGVSIDHQYIVLRMLGI